MDARAMGRSQCARPLPDANLTIVARVQTKRIAPRHDQNTHVSCRTPSIRLPASSTGGWRVLLIVHSRQRCQRALNTVSVIDTDSWTVTKTIKVGQRPRGIEFTRDGKSVLVAVGDDDKMRSRVLRPLRC
jgi:YVTN family beta-propeller protein